MRLSKIYQCDDEAMQRLQFTSFDGDAAEKVIKPQSSHPFRPMRAETMEAAAVAPVCERPEPAPAPPGITPAHEVEPPDTSACFEQAKQEGFEQGLQAGQAKLEQTAQALGEALTEVARLRESIMHNSRQDMLRLSVAIAEQVLQKQIQVDPEAILPVVERALKAAVGADHFTVRVHPDDLNVLNENKPLFLASLTGVSHLTFEGDPGMTPGGCHIDSDLGEVDATLETQLESVRSALTEVMGDC